MYTVGSFQMCTESGLIAAVDAHVDYITCAVCFEVVQISLQQ